MSVCSTSAGRLNLFNELQSMEAVSDDKRILKHIMIDILNLRNGMEDNLLLMQKVHHIVKNIKSVGLDLLNAITVVQQHIDSINTVYILGVSWLNDKTDFALSYIRGEEPAENIEDFINPESHENKENVEIYDGLEDQKNNFHEIIEEDIKIEIEDFENIVSTDLNLDHVKDEVEVLEKKEEARVISDLKTINDFAVTQFAEKAQYDPAIEEEKLDLSADLICKICNSKSASLPTLRRHMSDMHGEEKFQCDQCSFKTRRKPSLKIHILVEHKGHRLHCDRCEKAFTRKSNLERHILTVHEGKRYHCDQCDFVGSQSTLLKEHIDDVHKNILHSCDQCSFTTHKAQTLRLHKHEHKGLDKGVENENNSALLKQCNYCDKKVSARNFNSHLLGMHDKSEQYSCDQCGYETHAKQRMNQHMKRHEGNLLLCDQCPYIGKVKFDLYKHKQKVHEGISFPCGLCDYSSYNKGHLRTHKEAVHMGIKYQCDICDFRGSTKGNLKTHMETKHDETKYPCTQCDYKASTHNVLNLHMRKKH
ncbi:zinc finger protein 431 isoform X2 [Eurytemora carolleeae]|uniref:zinc finger protein 431 isoform X2 n=1 Tax=Eurytemora carolleeae TaxID=1294199 RepID=UPI000C7631E2|nr:zinc finger protein 431 isoform X2 [Eurytemora carolleeae]|eukprot:XP_023321211.1 zinc finger protein 431-like isoform X2 [Eurytemora affinis]